MKSQMEKMYSIEQRRGYGPLEIYASRYKLSCLDDLQNFVLEGFW